MSEQQNITRRFLGFFADVREGERMTAILLMFNLFVLLTAYLVLKTVRESLILSGSGAEVKSYVAAGQAVLLLVVVPWYGSFASKVKRIKLINGVMLFFISHLVAFYMLAQLRVPLDVAFFLWVGIFNLLVIAQFWAFANDLYTREQGERLFAIVAFGGALGGIVGPDRRRPVVWNFGRLPTYVGCRSPAGDLHLHNQRRELTRNPAISSQSAKGKCRSAFSKGGRVRPCPRTPLPYSDRPSDGRAQSGQYYGRIRPRQDSC